MLRERRCGPYHRTVLEQAGGDRGPPVGGALLRGHAHDLYDDLRLIPLLRKLMLASCRLTDAAGGSISIVDSLRERYIKIAERGTSCRLGQSFPLPEGVTGQVLLNRRPVVLARYRDVDTGHLPVGHPAGEGAVVGIPIWWRGDVIGVNVIFAGRPHQFTTEMVDQLEMLTQLVAPGLITASAGHPHLAHLTSRESLEADARATHAMSVASSGPMLPSSVSKVTGDLVSLAERAAVLPSSGSPLRVAVLQSDRSFRMLVRGDAAQRADDSSPAAFDADGWWELVDVPAGGVTVKRHAVVSPDAGDPPSGRLVTVPDRPVGPSPFTAREREVAALLARGLSDRAVAQQLVISPKTVEKHVSALLRKTGTTSRTAAVVRALEQGWLDPGPISN